MNVQRIIVAVPVVLLVSVNPPARAEQTVKEALALACVTDKWDTKEPEKGHRLIDYAGRCIDVPDDHAEPITWEECSGKYEYQPDGSWKGAGTCTRNLKNGDHITDTWEEGSHLKINVYKTIGGTGQHKGASGGGTYTMDSLSDTLGAGRLTGEIVLPEMAPAQSSAK